MRGRERERDEEIDQYSVVTISIANIQQRVITLGGVIRNILFFNKSDFVVLMCVYIYRVTSSVLKVISELGVKKIQYNWRLYILNRIDHEIVEQMTVIVAAGVLSKCTGLSLVCHKVLHFHHEVKFDYNSEFH